MYICVYIYVYIYIIYINIYMYICVCIYIYIYISLYIIFIDIYPFSNIATPRDVILEKKKIQNATKRAQAVALFSAIANLILRVLLGYPRDCVRLHLFITDISVDGDRKLRHFIDRTLRHYQLANLFHCIIFSRI